MTINDYGEIEFEDINEAFKIVKNVVDMEYNLGNHMFKDQKTIAAWNALEEFFGCVPDEFDPLDFENDKNVFKKSIAKG